MAKEPFAIISTTLNRTRIRVCGEVKIVTIKHQVPVLAEKKKKFLKPGQSYTAHFKEYKGDIFAMCTTCKVAAGTIQVHYSGNGLVLTCNFDTLHILELQ